MNSKIGYKLLPNQTATKDKAPFTTLAIPVGSLASFAQAFLDGDDESLELWTKDLGAKTEDITVTENDGGQRLTAKLSDAAEVPVTYV